MTAIAQPHPLAFPRVIRTGVVIAGAPVHIGYPDDDPGLYVVTDADFFLNGPAGTSTLDWFWFSTGFVIGSFGTTVTTDVYFHWDGFVILGVGNPLTWTLESSVGEWTYSFVGWKLPSPDG